MNLNLLSAKAILEEVFQVLQAGQKAREQLKARDKIILSLLDEKKPRSEGNSTEIE